jgi:MYXO-CTERM domain-containing protein
MTMSRNAKGRLRAICAAAAVSAPLTLPTSTYAYQGSTTPKLQVSGRFLQDNCNKNVLLHGWMQPTASWFNGEGNRYTDPTNWNDSGNVASMLSFMRDAATVMSDTSPKYGRDHGWYATFVRVNTDAVGGWTSEQGLVDQSQFDGWIKNFLVPYAEHLKSRGLYLVLCATGPMVVNVGGDSSRNMGQGTQQRMLKFWETVANAPGIKGADNVMFELMNEPVAIETSFGANDWGFGSARFWQALKNWMQPVVDTIRNTGADNVIWVPTLGWQGEPHGWAQYPISGDNVGIAAHFYPGYGGGVHDDATKVQNLWNSNYKPAADLKPMIITEMMWYPNSPGGYDDLFAGATAGFGNAIKKAIDDQGNVSFLVGFLADHLVDLRTTPPDGCTLGSHEGSQAYFDWLPGYVSAAPTCGAPGTSTDAGAPDAAPGAGGSAGAGGSSANAGGTSAGAGGSAAGAGGVATGGSGTGGVAGGTSGVAGNVAASGGFTAGSAGSGPAPAVVGGSTQETSSEGDASGCGCRSSAGRSNGASAVFLLLAAALVRRRRTLNRAEPNRHREPAIGA